MADANTPLAGKRILLGVSGGIACYKAVLILRELTRLGADVTVAMTAGAKHFVGELTFEALSGHRVIGDVLELDEHSQIAHVETGRLVDLIVVAPATCNTIAKLAHGLGDDAVAVTILASPAPLLVVPAMDHHMWQSAATQENLAILRRRGVRVLDPVEGRLASGATGWGRMQEPEAVVAAVLAMLEPGPLAGKRLLVTAGGTQEPIDPVRYVGNRSSGKMGVAIAAEAAARGAQVTLLHAAMSVDLPPNVQAMSTPTAADMAAAVNDLAGRHDAIVMAAAVADYRPLAPADQKIKKGQPLQVQLEPTEDILAAIADLPLIKVGFAAETQALIENARDKLRRKRLDLIVANDVSAEGSGFGSDTNQVVLIARDGSVEELPLLSKQVVAQRILDRLQGLLES
ncbi:MAG: bifunctional phosphopantothenoylcysteine decarboxylase/phosphopantothenate--cysteine ligase CoaBC [Chloroflexi bacterium]|nr:bifunctional phosphopantothenoylcysteine decarboxylase/phosphopantothenate--cysteine ligase CoaBC [Chloroflexota bacterium]